jgi:hypothetical protein
MPAVEIPLSKIVDTNKMFPVKMMEQMLQDMREGKRPVGVIASRKVAMLMNEKFSDEGFIGKLYCGGALTDGENLKFDAKKDWKGQQFILYTTSITVGVNFEELYFDNLYVYYQGTPLVRDLAQSMARVRQFKDKTIYFSIQYKNNVSQVKPVDKKGVEEAISIRALAMARLGENTSLLTNPFNHAIEVYNSLERNNQDRKPGFGILISEYQKLSCYKRVALSDEQDECDLDFNESILDYSSAYDLAESLSFQKAEELAEKRKVGLATITEVNALDLYYFMNKHGLSSSDPAKLKVELEEPYCEYVNNRNVRYSFHNSLVMIDRSEIKSVAESDSVDLSDPIVKRVAKQLVIFDILKTLDIEFDPMNTTEVKKSTFDKLNAFSLKKYSELIFSMDPKIRKMKNGKTIELEILAKDFDVKDKIRCVKYIMGNFAGIKCEVSKTQVRKRTPTGRIDITPVFLKPNEHVAKLMELRIKCAIEPKNCLAIEGGDLLEKILKHTK